MKQLYWSQNNLVKMLYLKSNRINKKKKQTKIDMLHLIYRILLSRTVF